MTQMTTQDWINHALTSDDGVWNIGQIDKATVKALDKLVSAGVLIKSRGFFHGISPLKTIWHKPSALFSFEERVTLHTAVGAAREELNNIIAGLPVATVAA